MHKVCPHLGIVRPGREILERQILLVVTAAVHGLFVGVMSVSARAAVALDQKSTTDRPAQRESWTQTAKASNSKVSTPGQSESITRARYTPRPGMQLGSNEAIKADEEASKCERLSRVILQTVVPLAVPVKACCLARMWRAMATIDWWQGTPSRRAGSRPRARRPAPPPPPPARMSTPPVALLVLLGLRLRLAVVLRELAGRLLRAATHETTRRASQS